MYLIPPIPVTNAVLLASNVAEADYPAWAISNAHMSFATQLPSVNYVGMDVSVDGTKLYIGTAHSDGTAGTIYQYTLTTPGDIFSGVYSGKSLSVATLDQNLGAFRFSLDGTKLYCMSPAVATIHQYTLATAWDVSTGTSASKSLTLQTNGYAFTISPDGLQVFLMAGSVVYQHTLVTAWDFSTGAYNASYTATSISNGTPGVITYAAHGLVNGRDLKLNSSGTLPSPFVIGTIYYVVGATTNTFNLSATLGGAAINTTTAGSGTHTFTTEGKAFVATAQNSFMRGIELSQDGTKMFLVGTGAPASVFQYTLTTALDVRTASYVSLSINVSPRDTSPSAIKFDSTGKHLYLIGIISKTCYQYALTTAYDLSTGSHQINAYNTGDRTMVVSPSGTVTVTVANPAVFTQVAHGLADNTPVTLTTTGALLTGLVAGTLYYVGVLTVDTYTLALKSGGTPVATSGTQSGTHTATAEVHQVFESKQDANESHYPLISPDWWMLVGWTNKWKMFDQSGMSQTANADSIVKTFNVIAVNPSVGLFNFYASTARITMSNMATAFAATVTIASPGVFTKTAHGLVNTNKVTLTTTGALPTNLLPNVVYYVVSAAANTFSLALTSGGAAINTSGTQSGTHTVAPVVFDTTYTLVNSGVRTSDIVELGMPLYTSSIITVTLTATGETVLCGTLGIGQQFYVGGTEFGAKVGIKDFSLKTTDSFGTTTFKEGDYAKRGTFMVEVDNTLVDQLIDTLSVYRAKPMIYVCTTLLRSTLIYGKYNDFEVEIAYTNTSILSTQVESLV